MELLELLRSRQLLTPVQLEQAETLAGTSLALEVIGRGWLSAAQLEECGGPLMVGPYRVLELIGAGGMGRVYKAQHRRLKRIVALKVIRADLLARNQTAVEQFFGEAEMAARLLHPNIVVVFDADEVDDSHYLAMEYVAGANLEDWVKERGPFPIAEACEYARQVALGLQHAHEHGVVHRDIKPSNLLVTLQRQARAGAGRRTTTLIKILDFGLAILAEKEISEVKVLGTPDYMSPEQAQNRAAVDIRADIYSLGCTLYTLLAGRPPFAEGTTALEKMVMHRTEAPRPLEELRTDMDAGLEALLAQLMAKNPKDRFAEPVEVAERLAEWAVPAPSGDAASSSGSSSSILKAIPWRDGVNPLELLRSKPGAKPAEAPVPPPPPARQEQPADAGKSKSQLVLPNTPAASGHQLKGHKGLVTALAFSADGKLLFSGGVDGTIHVWELGEHGGSEKEVTEGNFGEVSQLACSANNVTLASSAANLPGCVLLWDTSGLGLARTHLLESVKSALDALAFSPDARLLALSADKAIYLFDLASGKPRLLNTLKGHEDHVVSMTFNRKGTTVISGDRQGTIRTWDLDDAGLFGIRSRKLAALPGPVAALTLSVDGRYLGYGGPDHTLWLWDLSGARPKPAELSGHASDIRAIAFSNSGEMISLCGLGTVLLWSLETFTKVDELKLGKKMFYRATFAPYAERLALAHNDGNISVCNCLDAPPATP